MAPPKTALAAFGKILNAAEGCVWRQEIYRSPLLSAALAAGKVFNVAEGSIRRQKIYGSCQKVDVQITQSVWVPIKAAMGTVKNIKLY